jgi:excisionase family DNA binding protein
MNVDVRDLVGDGALGVPAACAFLSIGRSLAYAMMERGELRYVKLGKRRVIPRNELRRILAEGLSDGQAHVG